jgi:unsaturated rhamnogalacturonyl hydrolase
MLDGPGLRDTLDRLVDGMTGLRDEGRFHEPNLDGTRGDYISFGSWEWPQGVGLYGLARLWRESGDDRLEGWYDRALARGAAVPQRQHHGADAGARAPLGAQARRPLAPGARRLGRPGPDGGPADRGGGFQHDVSDKVNEGELWDDTLFMVALFLAAFGEALGSAGAGGRSRTAVLVHARYLTDTETGLWFHGWSFVRRDNFARARWARGNAWITAALADLPELCTLFPIGRAVPRRGAGLAGWGAVAAADR